MEYTGTLITGDFEDNTMTFEIKGAMLLQAGDYKIQSLDKHGKPVNSDFISDVTKRNWFQRMDLHWRLLYYMILGIGIGLLLPYAW